MIDTPQEAAIGDKAARELLSSEKLIASLENNDLFKRVQGEKALQVKHTPAPWKAVDREILEDGSVYPSHIVGGDDEKLVCYLEGAATAELAISHPNSFWYVNEAESANTQLIVAAPETAAERDKLKAINSELLEALKEIDERLTKCLRGNIYAYEAYDSYYQIVVRDAIAKAEGKA